MAIPNLRDRLRSIISDFRTQTSLREGCNVVLRSDCCSQMNKLYVDVRHCCGCVYTLRAEPGGKPGLWFKCVGPRVGWEWGRGMAGRATLCMEKPWVESGHQAIGPHVDREGVGSVWSGWAMACEPTCPTLCPRCRYLLSV